MPRPFGQSVGWLALGLTLATVLQAAEPPKPRQERRDTTADAATLADGSTVLGEYVDVTPNGGILMIVRRDWAKANQASRIERWEKTEKTVVAPAITKRLQRMETWKRDRETGKIPDDAGAKQLTDWIDKEIERWKRPDAVHASPLMLVKLGRDELRRLDRATKGDARFLRTAWIAKYRDPEDSSREDLMASIAGRGFDLKVLPVPSIDAMLPPASISEQNWQTRRAATELRYDPGLRFISYGGMVNPEPVDGQPADASTVLVAARSAISQLLGENPEDPVQKTFAKVAETGRVGAVVTELIIEPDLASVSVEMTLWVKSPEGGWSRSGSRKVTVAAAEVANQEGNALAQDPQISAVFKIAESLGLGDIGQDLKQKSLNIGAATKKALGQARELASHDLDGLALPVD